MVSLSYFLATFILAFVYFVDCKKGNIPPGIKLCEKNDPKLNECVMRLIEDLRPILIKGIPEGQVPPIDPLFLKEIPVSNPALQIKGTGHDVLVKGAGQFKLKQLKLNVNKLEVEVGIAFPMLNFQGTYDINGRILGLNIKGKGPFKGNATGVDATALLKGRLVRDGADNVIEFTEAKVNVKLTRYNIKVEKLFKDRNLNEAINRLLNDRSQTLSLSRPIINKVASAMVLEVLNTVSKNFAFDEIFLGN